MTSITMENQLIEYKLSRTEKREYFKAAQLSYQFGSGVDVAMFTIDFKYSLGLVNYIKDDVVRTQTHFIPTPIWSYILMLLYKFFLLLSIDLSFPTRHFSAILFCILKLITGYNFIIQFYNSFQFKVFHFLFSLSIPSDCLLLNPYPT